MEFEIVSSVPEGSRCTCCGVEIGDAMATLNLYADGMQVRANLCWSCIDDLPQRCAEARTELASRLAEGPF